MPKTVLVEGLTNQEFFEKYAAPGRVGLVGEPELINRLIGRAQRHLDEGGARSRWSHAFLFQGRRYDGHHWLVESDLDIKRKHIRLGVQENRGAKYFNEATTSSVAVIDFGLRPEEEQRVLAGALELVSAGARYSLREIAGKAWAMRHPKWRPRENYWRASRRFIAPRLYVTSTALPALISFLAWRKRTPHLSTSCGVNGRTRSGC